jgi:hypothetical protein
MPRAASAALNADLLNPSDVDNDHVVSLRTPPVTHQGRSRAVRPSVPFAASFAVLRFCELSATITATARSNMMDDASDDATARENARPERRKRLNVGGAQTQAPYQRRPLRAAICRITCKPAAQLAIARHQRANTPRTA